MAKQKNEGFRSGAGLIRYFDEDTKGPQIPPWFVVALCVATGVIVTAIGFIYPL